MKYIPILDRLLCTIPEAGMVLGYGHTKSYDLVKKGLIKTVDVDGRKMAVVASLRAIVEPLANAQQIAA